MQKRAACLFTLALGSVLALAGCGTATDPSGGPADAGSAGGGRDATDAGVVDGGRADGGARADAGGAADAGPGRDAGAVADSGDAGGGGGRDAGAVADSGDAGGGGGRDAGEGGGDAGGGGSYLLDPPDPCFSQFYVQGCESGACGGRCRVANACSPPESSDKSNLPMTFACPRFMLFSEEMKQAAKDDAAARGWGASGDSPFNYGVVGHDVDGDGLDKGAGDSTCCQCYQLIFDKPEPGSPQPPDLPIPKSMIVQSFNTAAGGGKNFDIFMGAGGFGAFNACVSGSYSRTQTTTFGHFMYSAFPSQYNGQGGIKFINLDECKVNGTSTVASMTSSNCQNKIAQMCDAAAAASDSITRSTRDSCKQTNLLASAYHQNWTVRAKKVECPEALTRVTGCRLAPAGLPEPNPNAQTVSAADSSFLSGYTTTTMQDCCKPTCAWKDYTKNLKPSGNWTSFYSCDEKGVPITSASP
jgi:hypothetical protein